MLKSKISRSLLHPLSFPKVWPTPSLQADLCDFVSMAHSYEAPAEMQQDRAQAA